MIPDAEQELKEKAQKIADQRKRTMVHTTLPSGQNGLMKTS